MIAFESSGAQADPRHGETARGKVSLISFFKSRHVHARVLSIDESGDAEQPHNIALSVARHVAG